MGDQVYTVVQLASTIGMLKFSSSTLQVSWYLLETVSFVDHHGILCGRKLR